jgi:hypothetical protein
MNTVEILSALERESQLLKDFRELSRNQLALLKDETPEALESLCGLLDQRSDMMLELDAIETTLETWIDQIRNDRTVTVDVLHELRTLNSDIIELAQQIVDIDERTQVQLESIQRKRGIA